MRRVAIALLLALLAAGARAEQLDETTATALRTSKKPLLLPVNTKTARNARVRIHFWVGLEGQVEAVEQVCGDQSLFDEIVDAVLDWNFRRTTFTTDLTFLRRGRRVWLLLDLPPSQRPKRNICTAQASAVPTMRFSHRPLLAAVCLNVAGNQTLHHHHVHPAATQPAVFLVHAHLAEAE